ncbi:hypothetical protein PAE9249_04324 [Paenibacillus sp. CECT 9249]|nr:hypothetical protein PAE9249_04324 [Paenibacillus sp. CECT 9249]
MSARKVGWLREQVSLFRLLSVYRLLRAEEATVCRWRCRKQASSYETIGLLNYGQSPPF